MTTRKITVQTCLIILVTATLFFLTCAVNPVTGKKEFMLLSAEDEAALGKETDGQIVQMYGVYDDPALTAYLADLGTRMGKLSHLPDLNFQFKVLDTPVVNAFAVPGGYIYMTRGILAHFNNEAELAGVIGHEIGHVTARHSAKQYSNMTLAGLGIGIGMVISEDFQKVAGLVQAGVGLLFLRFSRDNERQADDLGVEYSSKAGYDSHHMGNFFDTLMRMNPGSDVSGLPGWFTTHPNPKDRVKAVNLKTDEWQQKLTGTRFAVKKREYLASIDNIVYGEDPRQGYVDANTFYHPQMRFQFPIPANWSVINTPTQVQMMSKQEDAAIIFTLDDSQSPKQAADKFISQVEATIWQNDPFRVSGFQAQKLGLDIAEGTEKISVQSYFIKKQNNIFVFHGFASDSDFNKYRSTFTNTMDKFKTLDNPKRINVKPKRVVLRNVRSTAILKDIFTRSGVDKEKQEALAILNGMHLNDRIEKGTPLKFIVEPKG